MKTISKITILLVTVIFLNSCKKEEIKPDNTNATPAHSIGEAFEGGIIFWLDNTGQHGLVAATVDQGVDINWNSAYNKCVSYSAGTTNWWRLPTKEEQDLMKTNASKIGGFKNKFYWSSTPSNDGSAMWANFFGSGTPITSNWKSLSNCTVYVRAVKNF